MKSTLALLLPFGLATALAAQEAKAPESPTPPILHFLAARGMRQPGMFAKKLNLTDAQKASMKAIAQKHRDEMKAKHQAVREARQSFQAVLADPAAKDQDIQAAHQALSQRSLDALLAGRALRAELRAVLTPEQQAQSDKLREEWKAKREERLMHLRKGFGLDG